MTTTARIALPLLALLTLAAGCEPQYTPEEFHNGLAYDVYIAESKTIYAKLGHPDAEPTTEMLRAMILKNQSFEMDRMPIGYWNYLSMGGKFDKYITKEDVAGWAENGVTMMKGPYWNHDDPRQYAKMMKLLDWCAEYDVRLMLPDGRMGDPGDGTPGRTQESRADVAAHPAFFGYHCCDEPRFSPDDPRDGGTPAYAAWMKEQVPNARAFVSLGGFAPGSEIYVGTDTYEEYLARFGEFGDLDYFCGNQYSGMSPGRSGWNNYFGHMRLFREASWEYGIPFWASLCSVSHFGGREIDHVSQTWQFNAALGSGATGAVWYYYYMRDPQKDYRGAPIDAWWRRTETWNIMRDLNQGFHRRYGDLFMNMAVVKVSFLPEAYGGGNVFEPDTSDVVGNARAGYDTSHPIMISEFINLEGQRYVLVMNLDTEKSVFMGVRYLGDDVEIYSYDWDGNEYRGSSYAQYGVPWPVKRGPGVLDCGYQIGPGEMFVQRVDSTAIRQSELTLQMRELAGLEPQEPLELELARGQLAQALVREAEAKDAIGPALMLGGSNIPGRPLTPKQEAAKAERDAVNADYRAAHTKVVNAELHLAELEVKYADAGAELPAARLRLAHAKVHLRKLYETHPEYPLRLLTPVGLTDDTERQAQVNAQFAAAQAEVEEAQNALDALEARDTEDTEVINASE